MSKQVPTHLAPLVELVAPPQRPLRCGDKENWNNLKESVEFEFPGEFLDYGRVYGTGAIDSEGYSLLVANPLDPAYPKWLKEESKSMRTRGDSIELRQTRYYPEEDGLVPIGMNLSGDLIFYSTDGEVVSCPTGDPKDLIEYRLCLIDFLVTLFSGKLTPEYFPNTHIKKHSPVFKKQAWL